MGTQESPLSRSDTAPALSGPFDTRQTKPEQGRKEEEVDRGVYTVKDKPDPVSSRRVLRDRGERVESAGEEGRTGGARDAENESSGTSGVEERQGLQSGPSVSFTSDPLRGCRGRVKNGDGLSTPSTPPLPLPGESTSSRPRSVRWVSTN